MPRSQSVSTNRIPSRSNRHLSVRQHHWLTIIIMVLCLNVIWWQQPIFYEHFLAQAQHWDVWPLVGYSFSASVAIALMIRSNFTHRASYLFLVLSMLVIANSQIRTRFEILLLLLLFICFLFMIPQKIFQIKNALGLLIFSVLATYAIPVSIYFLANNFITQLFLHQSWIMLFAFLYFFTPLFLPNARGRLLSLATILFFWVTVLVIHGVNFSSFLAIFISLPPFLLQFSKRYFKRWEPMCALICLMLAICLLYQ
ncbi:hypothetical protein [Convivina praedatoris]|uniref:Uncharacterized protein n=1 Tax=Convivina praedatoris TaxID=2880963 RepID=A0ABN8HE90_9LACO|nr:hypothetical protein [Convivina sp. LMG 32447]CAH1850564.1 hypothetical protein R078138_00159 [Convivina sp. LMG 32447]CAH1850634.1 hypothetical protein LMG032447_00173 [Convivina sp. LMG 32447]CAH1850646.1 hypothetical protein R077815_00171 [Convivina sp. LMG 32447]